VLDTPEVRRSHDRETDLLGYLSRDRIEGPLARLDPSTGKREVVDPIVTPGLAAGALSHHQDQALSLDDGRDPLTHRTSVHASAARSGYEI